MVMTQFILSKLRSFAKENKGSAAIEAAIIFPVLFWAYAAMFTYFEAFRAQAVAEKAAYTISDMMSRETQPITPFYLNNTRDIFKDLSGLHRSETTLRISMIRRDLQTKELEFDWDKIRGDKVRLKQRTMSDYEAMLPTLAPNERLILIETASDYDPTFSVGISPRMIETFVFTRPRYAPQLVWSYVN